MPKIKLLLLPDGGVEAVYDDALARLGLGPIAQVERASHVEFSTAMQKWQAIDAKNGQVLAMADLRNDCVALERKKVHQQLVAIHNK